MYSVCGIFYNMGAFCKKLSWIKEYCSKLPLTMGIKYEKINVKKDSASLADKILVLFASCWEHTIWLFWYSYPWGNEYNNSLSDCICLQSIVFFVLFL